MVCDFNISPYMDKTDPWSSHSQIIFRLSNIPKNSRVLEIGTAEGSLGRKCSGFGFYLYGIEPNSNWAKKAKPYYQEMQISYVESVPEEFLKNYDVVIFADVLEHLINPLEELNRIVNLQKHETIFLISVPNIANLWIRINLLLGRFEYTDRGILDKTHLRFFTLKTIKKLLSQTQLKITWFRATPIPLNLVHPFFEINSFGIFIHRVLANLTKLSPTLLGYQFVFEARRRIVG